jgi:hypothetical protein
MNEPGNGRRLLWLIVAQSLAIAMAGIATWWLVWFLGGGRDTAWALAAIVWIIGSPLIDILGVIKARRGRS